MKTHGLQRNEACEVSDDCAGNSFCDTKNAKQRQCKCLPGWSGRLCLRETSASHPVRVVAVSLALLIVLLIVSLWIVNFRCLRKRKAKARRKQAQKNEEGGGFLSCLFDSNAAAGSVVSSCTGRGRRGKRLGDGKEERGRELWKPGDEGGSAKDDPVDLEKSMGRLTRGGNLGRSQSTAVPLEDADDSDEGSSQLSDSSSGSSSGREGEGSLCRESPGGRDSGPDGRNEPCMSATRGRARETPGTPSLRSQAPTVRLGAGGNFQQKRARPLPSAFHVYGACGDENDDGDRGLGGMRPRPRSQPPCPEIPP
eukprot:Cvel_4172.t1-p1 / transcript=Cvel_4172.t1 / gene=Cvel_4172 / organism=Chromera_velia_CCMP2878 / gene_product=hypothetical protein / transcript_product=hypothetical protein / location=Cvel_scaffold179:115481-116407(+) / protein_length=309 / sequence_SO=supercontig / SO=protein_coding / is_pseudo=false